MDIGTAKPSPAELARVPHHLIDIVRPGQEFNLPDFLERAGTAIEDIHGRGKLPMLVGGTMLYINALLEGWEVPQVAPRPGLREQLEKEAAERGPEALYRSLQELDPAAAAHINPLNVRRIVRALEVYYTTGQLFSEAQGKSPPPYRTLKLALTMEREALYTRADRRTAEMFRRGLVKEVQALLAAGYSANLPAMSSVGYKQVTAYLNGDMSLKEAQERMNFTTHRYIRQQYTWFRRDPEIQWLEATGPDLEEKALALVQAFLAAEQN
jgi:tRNA dimethylallyltransferase